ncbi:MAG: cation diffusion facilitator family transporter [Lachnospiraceae bacterium]|nr:cation diffusion facilitator family transporter [Lachnospiraceae bacterium]
MIGKEANLMDRKKATNRMAFVGIIGNVFLAVFKLVAGLLGHSAAMLSDAVHTLSDVFATFIAYIGVVLSSKEADEKHPFGHERLESVASMFLALILFVTGAGIGIKCIQAIMSKSYLEATLPGVLPVVAAVVSILVKEAMFWYTMYYAKKFNFGAFRADAWHHRSDALSSVGALVGIIGARHGFPILDQVAGIVICIVILYVAIGILNDAIEKMLDTSCDEEFEQGLKDFVMSVAEKENTTIGIDLLRTRKFGEKIYVELEICEDRDMKLWEAHDMAEKIHDAIEEEYPNVKHVMIHVNPS